MKKQILILVVITLVSRILGLGRELFLSFFYGTSRITDAYLVSLTIVTVVFDFIAVGVSTAYIPMVTEINEKKGERETNLFTSNLINIIFIFSILILALGVVFTRQLILVFASGFDETTLEIAENFTRIILFGGGIISISYVFEGFLQIKNNFIIPALKGIVLNLVIIFSIVLASLGNYKILAVGFLVGTVIQLIIMLPSAYRRHFRYYTVLNFKDENLKNIILLSLPLFFSLAVNQINMIVDRSMASNIAVGAISAMSYSNTILSAINGVFVVSIITVIYPTFSALAAKKALIELKALIVRTLNILIITLIPIMFSIIIFSKDLVKLILARGAFDALSLKMTSGVLFFYSFGILSVGLREVLLKAFYSLKETRIPTINSVIGITLNIILNLILSYYMGLTGLALATSISSTVTVILLLSSLRTKVGSLGLKKVFKVTTKVIFSSILVITFSYYFYFTLESFFNQYLNLFLTISISSLFYILLIILFRIDEALLILNKIRNFQYKG